MQITDRSANLFNLIALHPGDAPQALAILATGQPGLSWRGLVEFVSDTTAKLESHGIRRGEGAGRYALAS